MGVWISMKNTTKHNKNSGSFRRIMVIVFATLVFGSLNLFWLVPRANDFLNQDLLRQAKLVAKPLNTEEIKALSGTKEDLDNPIYHRLKDQLAKAKDASEKCRFIYLMGQKPGGEVFFFVDNEPIGSEDESVAGDIYSSIPHKYLEAFKYRKAVVVGPGY